MRGRCLLSVLGLLVAVAAAQAQPTSPVKAGVQAPATTPAPTSIEVHGAIPESIVGTWLAICNFKRADGHSLNKWHVYRFSRKDAAWHMEELQGSAPPELDKPLTAAEGSGKPYMPDDAAIKAMGAALPRLAIRSEAEAWSRIIWRTSDNFPKDFPPQAEGAKLSIEFIDVPTPGMIASGGAFYVKDIAPTKLSGDSTASGVAKSGFVVVPIDISGPFTMFRLQ